MNEPRIMILFDSEYRMLGECEIRGGAFANAILKPEGETLLRDAIEEWKGVGIPVRTESFGENELCSGFVRIPASDRRFGQALIRWAEERDIRFLALPADRMDEWVRANALPVTPVETYLLGVSLATASHSQYPHLIQVLESAVLS